MTTSDPLLLAVGRVGPALGLHGEVYVQPWTDSPDERFSVGSVLVTDPTERGPLTVVHSRYQGKRFLVRFAGVDDREAAQALRDTQLLIPAAQRPPLADPDDFYDSDLIGLAAYDPQGLSLGSIVDVVHAPACQYLVLRLVGDGRDVLVPFVAAIVPTVDLGHKQVVIDAPEGLLEL